MPPCACMPLIHTRSEAPLHFYLIFHFTKKVRSSVNRHDSLFFSSMLLRCLWSTSASNTLSQHAPQFFPGLTLFLNCVSVQFAMTCPTATKSRGSHFKICHQTVLHKCADCLLPYVSLHLVVRTYRRTSSHLCFSGMSLAHGIKKHDKRWSLRARHHENSVPSTGSPLLMNVGGPRVSRKVTSHDTYHWLIRNTCLSAPKRRFVARTQPTDCNSSSLRVKFPAVTVTPNGFTRLPFVFFRACLRPSPTCSNPPNLAPVTCGSWTPTQVVRELV